MRRVLSWLAVAAALYLWGLVAFNVANHAPIVAVHGFEPMTGELLATLFVRAAVFAIPLAVLSTLFLFFYTLFGTRRDGSAGPPP